MLFLIDLATLLTAVAALVAAIKGFQVGIRQIRAQTRSTNRKQWMNWLIEDLTELLAACEHPSGNAEKITRQIVELQLLLNPGEKKEKSHEALQARRELVDALRAIDAQNISDERARLPGFIREPVGDKMSRRDRMIARAQTILAEEWEMVMDLR